MFYLNVQPYSSSVVLVCNVKRSGSHYLLFFISHSSSLVAGQFVIMRRVILPLPPFRNLQPNLMFNTAVFLPEDDAACMLP